jgi:hypothetical protein
MSIDTPETPEGAAWALFLEIRREEEKAGAQQGSNEPVRTRLPSMLSALRPLSACAGMARDAALTLPHP